MVKARGSRTRTEAARALTSCHQAHDKFAETSFIAICLVPIESLWLSKSEPGRFRTNGPQDHASEMMRLGSNPDKDFDGCRLLPMINRRKCPSRIR